MGVSNEEVEAVAKAIANASDEQVEDWHRGAALGAIAALDRVRDARGDDEAGQRFWCPDCGVSEIHHDWCEAFPGEPVVHGNRKAPPARSPQGEDHEAGIPEAALDAAEQAVHACRRYALGHPSRKAIYVEARDEAYDVLTAALPYLSRVSAPKADENQEASQNDERRH